MARINSRGNRVGERRKARAQEGRREADAQEEGRHLLLALWRAVIPRLFVVLMY